MAYEFMRGLIDIRSKLMTNPQGGPRQQHPLAQKVGLVVHYNGPAVTNDDMTQIKIDAEYHCTEDWGGGARGDGIMYHVMIGRDGKKYLTRDLEAVLWHCAAWPQNGTALSVQVIMGDGQRATKEQLQSLAEVCDDWFAAGHGDPNTQLWGHQELSQTSCPGTLMDDFVRPYRKGTFVYPFGQKSASAAPAQVPAAPTPAKPLEIGCPTGKKFLNGFAVFFKSLDADQLNLRLIGWATSNEFVAQVKDQAQAYTYQVCERGVLTWRSGNAHPWDIYLLPEGDRDPSHEADNVRAYAKQNGL